MLPDRDLGDQYDFAASAISQAWDECFSLVADLTGVESDTDLRVLGVEIENLTDQAEAAGPLLARVEDMHAAINDLIARANGMTGLAAPEQAVAADLHEALIGVRELLTGRREISRHSSGSIALLVAGAAGMQEAEEAVDQLTTVAAIPTGDDPVTMDADDIEAGLTRSLAYEYGQLDRLLGFLAGRLAALEDAIP